MQASLAQHVSTRQVIFYAWLARMEDIFDPPFQEIKRSVALRHQEILGTNIIARFSAPQHLSQMVESSQRPSLPCHSFGKKVLSPGLFLTVTIGLLRFCSLMYKIIASVDSLSLVAALRIDFFFKMTFPGQ